MEYNQNTSLSIKNWAQSLDKSVLNSMKNGVVVVDRTGHILFYNHAYEQFIHYPLEQARGKLLTDLRPGALMPKTIAEGKSLVCKMRQEEGQSYFVDIYPIFENGEVIGGISMVTFLEHIDYYAQIMKSQNSKETSLEKDMPHTNGTHYTFDSIIYKSDVMARCIEVAKRVAQTDVPVLLQGESGCGKELFAQSIHNASNRSASPFIALNCATLNKEMLESELFGYMPGAFTGAKKEGKVGLFEAAEHGTLFLDEISEMDAALQAKLLRALQEKKIRRLGGVKEIPIDVRIISACNVDLMRFTEENRFRSDLYYRIATIPLQIPPLRERRVDIEPLVRSQLQKISMQKKQKLDISAQALGILHRYDWPGNVRELYNVLEYATLMCQGNLIQPEDLPDRVKKETTSTEKKRTLSERVKEFERQEIKREIEKYGNTVEGKKEAAKQLGISLSSLYQKLSET